MFFYDRKVVPVILEDSNDDLSALDAALDDRTSQEWVKYISFILIK